MAELKNIRIAISGIYDYALEELPSLRLDINTAPSWVEKKHIYKVYRPANVLAAACTKFKLLPLTHHHPSIPVDGSNFRDLAIGYTGENPWIDYLEDKNEVGIRSNVLLYDDEALNAYESGEKQLSPGYIADFDWQQGTSPNGEPYDIIMKAITNVNHLALLPAGRGGDDAVVMDKKATSSELERNEATGSESKRTEAKRSENIFYRGQFDKYKKHISIFDLVRMQTDADFKEEDHKRDNNGQFTSTGGNTSGEKKEKSKKGALKVLTKAELHDFINQHKNSKENVRVSLGDVAPEAKNRIKEKTGIDVKRVILDSDSIRHAFGKPSHNLEPDDLDDMMDIINKTNDITMSDEMSNGNQVLIFKKEEENGLILLEEFRHSKGKQDLELVTAYRQKKQRPQHNADNETNPGNNVQNDTVRDNSIAQCNKKRKSIFERVQGTVFDIYAK